MKKKKFILNIDEEKMQDKSYLKELELLFDKVNCIKDKDLRLQILRQIHICEQKIIKMCENVMNKHLKE